MDSSVTPASTSVSLKSPFLVVCSYVRFVLTLVRRITSLKQLPLLLCVCFITESIAQANSITQANIEVYTYRTKTPLTSVAENTPFDITGEESEWQFIRFKEPVIPVWVSSKHVEIDRVSNTVKVIAINLNARMNPSLDSRIINQINEGYQTEILEIRNEFVKVHAPSYFLYAINAQQVIENDRILSSQTITAENSTGWVMRAKDGQNDASIDSSQPNSSPVELYSVDQEEGAVIQSREVQQTESSAQQTTTLELNSRDLPIENNEVSNVNAVLANQDTTSLSNNNEYRLISGDSISVTVFGEPDLNLPTTRIPQSGVISFPLIGSVEVANKTTQEVEAILISTLSQGYINNPRLTVAIENYRPIFIKGAVNTTGSFAYTEGLTVAQALSLAGGTERTAKPSGVSIERNGRIFQQGLSLNSNVRISSGDILSVEEEIGYSEEGQLLYVYLHGEVNRPGEYQYRPGLTVEKAVVLAGGFSLRASKRKISVSRNVDDQEIPETLKKVPLYLPVNPGDIINVGASWF